MLGLVTLRASQSLFAPINTTVYASELSNYFSKIEKLASDAHLSPSVNLTALRTSISAVQRASSDLDVERADVQTKIEKLFNGGGLPYHARLVAQLDKNAELRELLVRVQKVNERLRKFERGFIDEKGLPGREWYRHLGVAPGRWLGYGATTFPGITVSFRARIADAS